MAFDNKKTLYQDIVAWLGLGSAVAIALSFPAIGAPGANEGATVKIASGNRAYIVQMADMPASAYTGGIKGYPATKPQKGKKLDPNSPAVVGYLDYLKSSHDAALAKVGGGKKLYSYGYVFNGFSADLSPSQAAELAGLPGVMAVTKDEARPLDTVTTPDFLGLSGQTGLWNRTGVKGEGVIVGIIDGGIWPEHPSFSDRTDTNGNGTKDGKLGYHQLPGWHGRCIPGEYFNASDCNQKLIGARYYNQGYGGDDGVRAVLPYEILSPRDFDGHGTHTASTAAGNSNVPVAGPVSAWGSTMSGMAPRARIAAYKVCWGVGGTANAGCFPSDSVAAIDQAVADGVDVINFSVSGTRTNFLDPVEVAFLYAADAGVFVATSAGNSGPTTSTVAHPGPWLTTVAAGTHNRDGAGSVTLGNNATYQGSSLATAVPSKPLILSTNAGLPGADPTAVSLCYAAEDNAGVPVLDPAKVAGKIVVCDRGVTARVNKSLAVQQAGGVGMILANTSPNSLNADLHHVPTVHVQDTDRAAIQAYAALADASATIHAAAIVLDVPAPYTASFSSRGPLLAGNGDLLKPDLMAPGQDILAGVSPMANGGVLFELLSGTSMSSPHVAGLAALFKELKPDWSPMAIKSALMTSASDVLDGPNTHPLVIFRQGAGHVQPNRAADAGLVFDAGWNDWMAFLCGTTNALSAASCNSLRTAGYSTDPSDLNTPSIAIGDLTGTQSVKRRVKNIGSATATYSPSVAGLTGFTVNVAPASLTLAPGETKPFTVNVQRTTAALNAYEGGQLTLTSGTTNVRVPLVVRPVALAAPAAVSGTGGAISYAVKFGYDGPFSASPRGLVAADITPGSISDDPTNGDCSLATPNAALVAVSIPAGTSYARFSLFDADVATGSDIDLCVFNAGGTLVGSSGSATSNEEVNLQNPAAGTYKVVVHGYELAGSVPFKLHTWLVGNASAGNMTVAAPTSAATGATGTVQLTFNSLQGATRYLGTVAYGGVAGMPNPTVVTVSTP